MTSWSAFDCCSTFPNSIAAVPYRDQVLIFDADDTLWEFNHLFERVIDDYLEWLAHPTHSTDEIRAVLLDIEAANAAAHGYGTHVFLRSLRDCFLHLNERPATAAEQAAMDALAVPLLEHHVTPLPGVVETLSVLGTRHRLLLLTKGATDEQQRKIDASALAPHFEHVHIVAEKDVDTYRDLADHHQLDPVGHVDDRQLTEVGRRTRPRRRPAGGLHPQRQHVGARAHRAGSGRRRHPAPACGHRTARPLLNRQARRRDRSRGRVRVGAVLGTVTFHARERATRWIGEPHVHHR